VIVGIEQSYRDLARQQAELALRFGSKPTDDDVVARLVCPVEVALYQGAGVRRPRDWRRPRGGIRAVRAPCPRAISARAGPMHWCSLRANS